MKHLRHIVRNQSSRNGARPRLIVLHTTEGHNRPGVSDLTGLANLFDHEPASSHKGIDSEGNVITMVEDSEKAWTQCNFNPVSLSIEQIGFAAESKAEWIRNHHEGLRTVAKQVAHWSRIYGIPIVHSTYRGVCQHKNLGQVGCGHVDCGPGYPERLVRVWAALYRDRFNRKGTSPIARIRARRVNRELRCYGVHAKA